MAAQAGNIQNGISHLYLKLRSHLSMRKSETGTDKAEEIRASHR